LAQLFFLSCLGLTGFPISPTFVGEDLLFSHIEAHQVLLVFIVSFTFIIDGLSIIRIYARIFMGTHVKKYHEIAFKSS
jgi:formate hydrogenlyase subunit 3/multisubunit Na+/H+ antiporter MnhD subunit